MNAEYFTFNKEGIDWIDEESYRNLSEAMGKLKQSHTEFPRFSSMPQMNKPALWLERQGFQDKAYGLLVEQLISEKEYEACCSFGEHGYWIAQGLIKGSIIDQAFSAYDKAIKDGTIVRNEGDTRFLNPHNLVKEVKDLMFSEKLKRYINLFTGTTALPFQSIGAHYGSQQLPHSDAIHMTTYPIGFMTAAWVACEDISLDSGPLEYYPKSHKLKYKLSDAVGIELKDFEESGYQKYSSMYEPAVQETISDSKVEKKLFEAKKGDVLFWHHNLLHGGSPIFDESLTRHSFVFHYFAKAAFCYHDLAASVANIPFEKW